MKPPPHKTALLLPWRASLGVVFGWLALGTAIGVLCGCASAAFLALLDLATHFREQHPPIIYALPVAGLVIGAIYERLGRAIAAGNNLVIDTIHEGGPQIPMRMAPLVLLGTVLTHLFGGSAGREGTAVQMGATLADALSHRLRLSPSIRRQLLVAGVAGGFGSVFGTPIAGVIFGLEFVVLGRLDFRALVPALVSAAVGDEVTRRLGIVHTHYPTLAALPLSTLLFGKWLVFAVAVALTTILFIELQTLIRRQATSLVPRLPLRMAIGGSVLVVAYHLLGTPIYQGLGVPTIVRAFHDPSLAPSTFALKALLTAITLGTGFLGGEVTPLFFVGAALGNVLARLLGLPLELAVGVGLAAVFAAASNAPLALSVMAIELLGDKALPHVVIVCVIAYLLTGHRSIYAAQRVVRFKLGGPLAKPTAIRDLRTRSDMPKPP